MTRAMHPLKAFVYCSLGVPVVSTELSNLEELSELITVTRTRDEFVAAIDAAVARPRRPLDARQREILDRNSWPVRAQRVLELVDVAAERLEASIDA
jgi:hypothetical protein